MSQAVVADLPVSGGAEQHDVAGPPALMPQAVGRPFDHFELAGLVARCATNRMLVGAGYCVQSQTPGAGAASNTRRPRGNQVTQAGQRVFG